MKNYMNILIPVLVFGIAIALIIVGAVKLTQQSSFEKVPALIQRIEEEESYDSDGTITTSYRVFVEYTVDGVTYNGELSEKKGNYDEGKTVDILVDPANPKKIAPVGASTGIMIIVVGAVFLAAGVAIIVNMAKNKAAAKSN